MMWIDIVLVLLSMQSNQRPYWDYIRELNHEGCSVYNQYYVSCPANVITWGLPKGAIPIPDDAVPVAERPKPGRWTR